MAQCLLIAVHGTCDWDRIQTIECFQLEVFIKMKKSRAVISLLLLAAVTGLMAYAVLIGFGK